ncbi:GAF domain-containing protein [Demequina sp. SYSU T00068]|uniref:GAF domain-containing sensor histidine kinase n=1 Tax=Demequina lignilytica TaxID=3051663 RepID=UPI002630A38B|nr:GAF domain-containing protein [Demequina sp. SYSU T00068]MDN4489843.1 GAF domain-containing protein [Demequina sp. SYSU T00068]
MTDLTPKDGPVADALTEAIVSLNAQLDLAHTLDMFLTASTEHTGAKFAAINVLDDDGKSVEFHFRGMPEGVWASIGRAPNAVGVLGQIPAEGSLVLEDLTMHPAFRGMPKDHPPMGSFLGTALKVRGSVFGYLYLASKEGGFTERDEHVVEALAAAASVAIDNAQLYEQALHRENWLKASQNITTALLADPGDEEVFETIVEAAKDLSNAQHAALVLPGVDGSWTMEITSGPRFAELLGLQLPPKGMAVNAIETGKGVISAEPPGAIVLDVVQSFGPTMYAPLRAERRTVGLLMLWRDRGAAVFSPDDLAIAQRFANQAAMALSVAELSHVKNMTSMLEERQRLADDLHDFVSQELFATAMQIESIADECPDALRDRLLRTLDHVKRAQREVRGVMGSLSGQRTSEPISERIRREIVLAQDSLGFAPRVQVDWAEVSHAIAGDPTLSDDVVAVVREMLSNVARHARATAVTMSLSGADGRLAVQVTDDGIGPGGATNRHSGTSNLANRALRRNGTFTLAPSRPGAERPGTVAEWNVEAQG